MACNCKTEVYSRIVGYYRPVQQWNKGKKAEYDRRKTFKLEAPCFDEVRPVETVKELEFTKSA
jgi:ribonucleoside-triphosphate reductase